mmetsp:Transcript_11837/g.29653  ORF Transcript_11837/g.29653 Transcript_11837/m.29653 type:complete len:166 (+) Transcript_11837:402-899(+)
MTMILSAFWMVESLCAMTRVVLRPPWWLPLPSSSWSRAACTICSLLLSRALVASSSSSTLGFDTMARAMAMRCFWPPESCVPRSPHMVSKRWGSLEMNWRAFALWAAASTSWGVAVSLPYIMFSMMVVANRTGSCDTSPSDLRSHRTLRPLRSTPSRRTVPDVGS